jgi:hypothetical protein
VIGATGVACAAPSDANPEITPTNPTIFLSIGVSFMVARTSPDDDHTKAVCSNVHNGCLVPDAPRAVESASEGVAIHFAALRRLAVLARRSSSLCANEAPPAAQQSA